MFSLIIKDYKELTCEDFEKKMEEIGKMKG